MSGWTASIAATAVSSYALDAWAAAAGVALVASGLLADVARPWAVALLVGSYVAWGLGLRTNQLHAPPGRGPTKVSRLGRQDRCIMRGGSRWNARSAPFARSAGIDGRSSAS
jgi:hypothetical protein